MKRTFTSTLAMGILAVSLTAFAGEPDPEYVYPVIGQASEFFIPPGCTVEDWCLVSASPRCVFVGMSYPNGLYRAHVQYSVVRRAYVNCGGYYRDDRRVITGPVEAIPFESTVQATQGAARGEIFPICEREDWVSQAPSCSER